MKHRLNTFSFRGETYRLWLIAPEKEAGNSSVVSTVEFDDPANDEVYILDKKAFIRPVDGSRPEDWEFEVTQPNGDPLPAGQQLPEGVGFEVTVF